MTHQFFLEIRSEDIPARMQKTGQQQLCEHLLAGLADHHLDYDADEVIATSTPNRFIVKIDGLPSEQPTRTEEVKGPSTKAPDKAIEGFMRGHGINDINECHKIQTEKGEYWAITKTHTGQAIDAILPDIIVGAIAKINWPKSMRWGRTSFTWPRPLRSIIALLDTQVIDGQLALGDKTDAIQFSNQTIGHPILSPDPITINGWDDYRQKMADAKVLFDREKRLSAIQEQATALTNDHGLQLRDDPALMAEVTGLVEYPTALIGTIDDEFMELPREVLITSMRTHQRYFALEDTDKRLAAKFLVISNMPEKIGDTVVNGNERVLRARLADAKFFYERDREKPLADHGDNLDQVIYHDNFGTMADKADIMAELAEKITPAVADANPDFTIQAARLAKADLVTQMVDEFPDLQGVIGARYALADGLPDVVAGAIGDHYKPAGANDDLPSAPNTIVVSLAEKLSNLYILFLAGERPTGSSDPFALRRAALGLIRLILANNLRLNLHRLYEHTADHLPAPPTEKERKHAWQDIAEFVQDRLMVLLRDQGMEIDILRAVFETTPVDDITHLVDKTRHLQNLIETSDGKNLLTAYRRAGNILESIPDPDHIMDELIADITPDHFEAEIEETLTNAIKQADAKVKQGLREENFETIITALAGLRRPLDQFFDRVMVNADDPAIKQNRHAILMAVIAVMNQVADFSHIDLG
jgi:glycyl-tRNA synthetase beta chain